MGQSIINYMRKKFNLLIGDSTTEKIKKKSVLQYPRTQITFLMKGRDIRSGTPKEISLTEVCEALMPILNQMLSGIKEAREYAARIICGLSRHGSSINRWWSAIKKYRQINI